MKFSVSSKVTKFKPTKKFLLITGASLLVLVLIVASIAVYQKHQDNVAAAQAATRATEQKAEQARTEELKQLKEKVTNLESDKTSLCLNYTNLSTTKPTRGLVVVPTACSIKR